LVGEGAVDFRGSDDPDSEPEVGSSSSSSPEGMLIGFGLPLEGEPEGALTASTRISSSEMRIASCSERPSWVFGLFDEFAGRDPECPLLRSSEVFGDILNALNALLWP